MLKPKNTVSKHVKKTRPNTGELKRKYALDKQFKLKLSNIYSKKLSKFNLEKQLNTIHKKKHANCTNNIVRKLFNKNAKSQSDSNSSDRYESNMTQKLAN